LSDTKKVNPKRLARQAAYELSKNGVSTHAQKAMNLEYEKNKREKQTCSNQQREAMKARIRELKEKKAKEKHRGH
jgi:hypothetical protein